MKHFWGFLACTCIAFFMGAGCESGEGEVAEEEGSFRCGLPPGNYEVVARIPREDGVDNPPCLAHVQIMDGDYVPLDEGEQPWLSRCGAGCECGGGSSIDSDGQCRVLTWESCRDWEAECTRTTNDQGDLVGECVYVYQGAFDGFGDCHISLDYRPL